jgi:hypothetical protein
MKESYEDDSEPPGDRRRPGETFDRPELSRLIPRLEEPSHAAYVGPRPQHSLVWPFRAWSTPADFLVGLNVKRVRRKCGLSGTPTGRPPLCVSI